MQKKICDGIAINRKTGKKIRFTVPATFPESTMEKLRTNLKIIQINGTNLSKFGATTDGVCYMIKEELKDAKAKKITEQAFAIQEKAEQRAEKEAGLETWQKKQLVADVVVRELEILSGEKTFEQVYREELMYYRK